MKNKGLFYAQYVSFEGTLKAAHTKTNNVPLQKPTTYPMFFSFKGYKEGFGKKKRSMWSLYPLKKKNIGYEHTSVLFSKKGYIVGIPKKKTSTYLFIFYCLPCFTLLLVSLLLFWDTKQKGIVFLQKPTKGFARSMRSLFSKFYYVKPRRDTCKNQSTTFLRIDNSYYLLFCIFISLPCIRNEHRILVSVQKPTTCFEGIPTRESRSPCFLCPLSSWYFF